MSAHHVRFREFSRDPNFIFAIRGFRLIRCKVPKEFVEQLKEEERRKGTLLYVSGVRNELEDIWQAERAMISNRENFTFKLMEVFKREGKGHIFIGKPLQSESNVLDLGGFEGDEIISVKLNGKIGMGLAEVFAASGSVEPQEVVLNLSNLQETKNLFFEQSSHP